MSSSAEPSMVCILSGMQKLMVISQCGVKSWRYFEKRRLLGKHSVSAVLGTQRQAFQYPNQRNLIRSARKEVAKRLVIGKSLIPNCVFAPTIPFLHDARWEANTNANNRELRACGHNCLAKCHSQVLHEAIKCGQRCERLFDGCGHPCPKTCGELCSRCKIPISNVTLPCGHTKKEVLCYDIGDLTQVSCRKDCKRRNAKLRASSTVDSSTQDGDLGVISSVSRWLPRFYWPQVLFRLQTFSTNPGDGFVEKGGFGRTFSWKGWIWLWNWDK